MKVEVNSYRLVRIHHENLVIRGTRLRGLRGDLTLRGLGSHISFMRERIGKTTS